MDVDPPKLARCSRSIVKEYKVVGCIHCDAQIKTRVTADCLCKEHVLMSPRKRMASGFSHQTTHSDRAALSPSPRASPVHFSRRLLPKSRLNNMHELMCASTIKIRNHENMPCVA